jgi:hypothetical protein
MGIIIILVIIILVTGWLAYEMIVAPLMPDDYGLSDEEIREWEELEKEKNKKPRLLNKHDRDPEWDKLK